MEPFPKLVASAPKREDMRGWLQVLYESDTTVLKRSFSRAGVFRGLHRQGLSNPQMKLIRVVEGRIIDFVVDVSDELRTIHRKELCPADEWVQIDACFAHGFYALEDTLFEYVCDGGYNEASEEAYSIVDYLEAQLVIENPILSDKDRAAPPL